MIRPPTPASAPRGLCASGALLLLGLLAGQARAQTTMSGTCSGTVGTATIAGTVYLNVDGVRVSPMTSGGSVGGVFSLSECECDTQDINLEIVMTTPVPMATQAGLSMFVGQTTDCTDNTRTTTCEDVTASTTLTLGSFKQPNVSFLIPLPARKLMLPLINNQPRATTCENITNQTRSLAILIGDLSSPAKCTISIPISTSKPPAPTDVGTNAGNGAVNLTWTSATVGENVERYQILCRDRSQPDVAVKPELEQDSLFYSVCLDPANKDYRRRKNIPGTGITTPTGDMAKASFSSGAVQSILPPRGPGAGTDAVDGGSDDMGAAEDMAAPAPAGAFEKLDPRFLCSADIRASGTQVNVRIDGLANGHIYDFIVVAIDPYGNPSEAAAVSASPTQTQNLLEAARDAGNYPGGFGCAMNRLAQGEGAAGAAGAGVLLGSLGLWLGLGRRRRAAAQGRKDS